MIRIMDRDVESLSSTLWAPLLLLMNGLAYSMRGGQRPAGDLSLAHDM